MTWGTVVLTGATSGIGEATALRLASMTETLVLLGPEPEDTVGRVLDAVRRGGTARIHYVRCDFSHLAELAVAARTIRELTSTIDLLIQNAGVPGAPERVLTDDGFERTLQVNALAPALLTRLLVPSLAAGARVVAVASSAHRVEQFDLDDPDIDIGYTAQRAYCRAKLAMLTWSSLFAEEEPRLTSIALCPGLNDTALSAAMTGGIGGPPSEGAARVLFAALAAVPSGSYLENDRVVHPSGEVTDATNRQRLAQLYRQRLTPFAG